MGKFVIGTKNSKDVEKIKKKMEGLEGKLEIASQSGDSCCPTLCKCRVYDGDWMTNKEYFPKGGLIISVAKPLKGLQIQAECNYTFTNYNDKISAFGFDGLLVTVYLDGRVPKKPSQKKSIYTDNEFRKALEKVGDALLNLKFPERKEDI